MSLRQYRYFLLIPLFFLTANMGGVKTLHNAIAFIFRPSAWSQVTIKDAGREIIYPPSVLRVVDELRTKGISHFAISPELEGHLATQVSVAAYPIIVDAHARVIVVPDNQREQMTKAGCHMFLDAKEIGIADCDSAHGTF